LTSDPLPFPTHNSPIGFTVFHHLMCCIFPEHTPPSSSSNRLLPTTMDRSNSSSKASDPYRGLRIIAMFDFIAALALLLPCGILTNKPLPALGIAPMFFSAASQLVVIGARPQMPISTVFINLLLAVFLFSILIPRSVRRASVNVAQNADILLQFDLHSRAPPQTLERQRLLHARHLWNHAYDDQLVSLCISPQRILSCLTTTASVIHLYLALRAFLTIQWNRHSGSGCCCHNPSGCLRPDSTEILAGRKGDNGVREPIMGFYNDHGRPSSEFQTSGFNTPRVSQDTLNSSVRQSGDLV
jgi:hypothetical protein